MHRLAERVQLSPIMDTRAIATFDLHSEQYARYRPQYPDMLFRWLQAAVSNQQRAWDCATGTGQAAGKLALLFDRVDACDINHSQLEAAERSANVFYLECPVEQSPYGDAVFDLITVAQSLHWFDFPRFWPQVERTLKPGGVFAAWGYDWFQVSPEVDDAMRFFRAVIEPFWSSCSQLLWDGYRHRHALPALDAALPDHHAVESGTAAGLSQYLVCHQTVCAKPGQSCA
jgi:ubiquinone/menaquinone biosynthesis C-methylase UbiE